MATVMDATETNLLNGDQSAAMAAFAPITPASVGGGDTDGISSEWDTRSQRRRQHYWFR